MTVVNMSWNWITVGDFDSEVQSFSTTVQVLNRTIVADIGLFSTETIQLVSGRPPDDIVVARAFGHISQIVSDSGVENFPTQGWGVNSPPTLFRVNVTSVTFKVVVYRGRAKARWMIYDWV